MPLYVLWFLATIVLTLVGIALFLLYVAVRYTPVVARIFEEKPLFLPLRVKPLEGTEEVRFKTRDGLELAGTYLPRRVPKRLGVIVFCHEYLSDRWSALPYADHLRDEGFDLFTFDFRNHGQSEKDAVYKPLQWVTEHESADLRAALRCLRSRPDCDPAGFALLGISRGGGTALVVAGKDPSIWGVVTDGAFPTKGTMLAYIIRWSEIYVTLESVWKRMPKAVYEFLAWSARKRSQRRLHCRFPNVEKATSRISPRPLFMIHGEKDAYIGPAIAKTLFAEADEPKQLWIVPKAKHNRSRETEPETYRERLTRFFLEYAPRVASIAPPVELPAEPVYEDESLGEVAAGADVSTDEIEPALVGSDSTPRQAGA